MKLLWGSWRTIRNFLVPRDYGEGSSWVHDVWHIMHISTRIWGCSMACKVCKLLNVFSILLCRAVFLGWSFSLQCSQKTRWVCGTRGEGYLSHKQYWPMKSSSLILQHAPVWVAAGYSLTNFLHDKVSWTERPLWWTSSPEWSAEYTQKLTHCCGLSFACYSKSSAKSLKYPLHQCYSSNSDFLQRRHTADNESEGLVTVEKAFPFRHILSLLMVLAAGLNRAGRTLRPKEKFWHNMSIPAAALGALKWPTAICELIPVAFSKGGQRAGRSWGNPAGRAGSLGSLWGGAGQRALKPWHWKHSTKPENWALKA